MVCRDAVQEIDIHLLLVGCLHTFDDTEVVHGGLERGDVADIARLEPGLIGFTIPLREKRRLEGHVEQQSRHLLARRAGIVRNIAVHSLKSWFLLSKKIHQPQHHLNTNDNDDNPL